MHRGRVRPVENVLVAAVAPQLAVHVAPFVIQPAQQRVADVGGGEFSLQLVVDAQLLRLDFIVLRPAIDGVVVTVVGVEGVHQIFVGLIHIGVAQVLLEGERLAEAVVENIAHRGLLALRLVVARIADVKVVGDPPRAGGKHRAVGGQEVTEAGLRLVLVAGQQGETGVGIGQPGERRGDGQTLLLVVFHRLVLGAGDAVQPVEQRIVIVQPAAEVKRRLAVVAVAAAEADFVNALGGGALAGHADNAPGFT